MASYVVRPVTMIEESPGLEDRGARVAVASGAAFKENNLVTVGADGARDVTAGDNASLAFVAEPAVNRAYKAAGVDYANTKSHVEVQYIGGKSIAITLTGAYAAADIGTQVGVAVDASGYVVADKAQANKIGTIRGVYGNQVVQSGNNVFLQDNVADGDTNVYVIVEVDPAVALPASAAGGI